MIVLRGFALQCTSSYCITNRFFQQVLYIAYKMIDRITSTQKQNEIRRVELRYVSSNLQVVALQWRSVFLNWSLDNSHHERMHLRKFES